MSKLMKSLSNEEIKNYTEKGGFTKAQCTYYLALCASGYDSGTCDYILKSCGYTSGTPSDPGCGTCTCH